MREAIDVPSRKAKLSSGKPEKMFTPGAETSTAWPKLEKVALRSFWSVAATAMTSG